MPKGSQRTVDCVCCGQSGPLNSRGLITACHERHRRNGTLCDFPRATRSRDDVLDEWCVQVRHAPLGMLLPEIAAIMGMKAPALRQALGRARKAGDPRAIYLNTTGRNANR